MVDLVQAHPSGGYILDELHVGMAAEKTVHVTEERIRLFAEASDDFNPVHLDEAFAAKTAYRGRIAHGLGIEGQAWVVAEEQALRGLRG